MVATASSRQSQKNLTQKRALHMKRSFALVILLNKVANLHPSTSSGVGNSLFTCMQSFIQKQQQRL